MSPTTWRLLAAAALVLAAGQAGAQDTTVKRDTIRRDSLARTDSLARRDSLPAVDRTPAVRVCGGGDVTLGNNLDSAWAANATRRMRRGWRRSTEPDSLLAPLRPLVEDADVVLLNVESAIGEGRAERKCGPRSTSCYAFRAPTAAAAALRGVAPHAAVVGNVANNHARDAGPAGYRATQRHLEAAGVHVVGADTLATPVATAAGDTVAFLGFYTSTETPDVRDLAAVRRHVARARARWPMVVVTAHMGAEGRGAQRTRDTTEIFLGRIDRGNPVAFARTAFEAGAALVLGHGPHVMRAAQWHDGRLAFYSLGNLLTFGPFNNGEPSNRGAIACATITPDGVVTEASLRSTVQLAPGVVQTDAAARAAALVDSLGRLDFRDSGVRVGRDGTILVPARPVTPADTVPRDTLPIHTDTLPPRDTVPVWRDTLPPRRDTLPVRRDTLPPRRDTLPPRTPR